MNYSDIAENIRCLNILESIYKEALKGRYSTYICPLCVSFRAYEGDCSSCVWTLYNTKGIGIPCEEWSLKNTDLAVRLIKSANGSKKAIKKRLSYMKIQRKMLERRLP